MNEYIVTFEQKGEVKTAIVRGKDPGDVRFNVTNANGKVDYFHSILLNENDPEE